MIRLELFCTRCNASAQRREPGDEVSTGYAHVEFVGADDFWRRGVSIDARSVALPSGWTHDAKGLLMCGACDPGLTDPVAVAEEIVQQERERDPDWREVQDEANRLSPAYAAWPARKAPFDGE